MSAAHVYEGAVKHARLKPKRHRLAYSVYSFLLDVDRIDEMTKASRWFSRGRFNLFSFHDCDHGAFGRDKRAAPGDISAHIRGVLGDAGFADMGQILLLCYPRVLGYAFNPLSVYYCHDLKGRLTVMIYEVRNTFGGRHSYIIPVAGSQIDQQADKLFHVSPFNEMDLTYRFLLSAPEENLKLFIQTSDAAGPVLNASFTGRRAMLDDKKLLSLFWRYPLMTLKVMIGIHWEAAKLIAKGMWLKPGAPDPAVSYTVVGAAQAERKAA